MPKQTTESNHKEKKYCPYETKYNVKYCVDEGQDKDTVILEDTDKKPEVQLVPDLEVIKEYVDYAEHKLNLWKTERILMDRDRQIADLKNQVEMEKRRHFLLMEDYKETVNSMNNNFKTFFESQNDVLKTIKELKEEIVKIKNQNGLIVNIVKELKTQQRGSFKEMENYIAQQGDLFKEMDRYIKIRSKPFDEN